MTKRAEVTPAKITGIAVQIVRMLTPLSSIDRQKAIQASLTLLGESNSDFDPAAVSSGTQGNTMHAAGQVHMLSGVSPKATAWLKQNGITSSAIENVFDIAGGEVNVIASKIEGKNLKERTLNAYVIQGIGRLLVSGEPAFDDKSARSLCETQGCYNSANHAVYMGAKGNLFTGSKDKGWRLTAPGLKRGAEIVKAIAQGA